MGRFTPRSEADMDNGFALAMEGAERAADHAGEDWKDAAFDAFVEYAVTHSEAFTTEDVRFANPHLDNPPDKRAWGAVAMAAKRAGYVERAGFKSASDPKVHANMVTAWVVSKPKGGKRDAVADIYP